MDNLEYAPSPRRYLTSGPLILDALRSIVIVDGERLALNETQADALYLLMQREGTYLKFEKLYNSLWRSTQDSDCRDVARMELDQLAEKLNAAGQGALYVEHTQDMGYRFLTLKP